MASRNPVNSPVEVGSFIVLLYPIIFKVLDMPGAGFLPSTVCLCQHNQQKQSGRPKNLRLRKLEERFCTYDSNVSREKLEKNHTTNAGTFSNHQGGFVLRSRRSHHVSPPWICLRSAVEGGQGNSPAKAEAAPSCLI